MKEETIEVKKEGTQLCFRMINWYAWYLKDDLLKIINSIEHELSLDPIPDLYFEEDDGSFPFNPEVPHRLIERCLAYSRIELYKKLSSSDWSLDFIEIRMNISDACLLMLASIRGTGNAFYSLKDEIGSKL